MPLPLLIGAGASAAGGLLSGLFGGKKKVSQSQYPIDPALAQYWRDRAAGLSSDDARDSKTAAAALGAYNETLPFINSGFDKDMAFLESTRPGGTEEQRFDKMISDQMAAARGAYGVGLDRARAQTKSRMALGGNSAFADSKYARQQEQTAQTEFEKELALMDADLRRRNALDFLYRYRPGATMQLGAARTQYAMTPLEVQRMQDALWQQRAAATGQGLRTAIDTNYNIDQKKGWADYLGAGLSAAGGGLMSYGVGNALGLFGSNPNTGPATPYVNPSYFSPTPAQSFYTSGLGGY